MTAFALTKKQDGFSNGCENPRHSSLPKWQNLLIRLTSFQNKKKLR